MPRKAKAPPQSREVYRSPRYTRTTWVLVGIATLMILASHLLLLQGDTVINVFLSVIAFLVLIPWALLKTHAGD